MKTLAANLKTHMAGETTTLATLWKITRKDAQVFGFTDHDADITLSGVTYEASAGYSTSAVESREGLAVSNLEVSGILMSSAITEADLIAGLWDGATVEISLMNWNTPTDGTMKLSAAQLGNVRWNGERFVAELHGIAQRAQQPIGRIVTASCDADLGDSRCGVSLGPLTASTTVTSTTDARNFVASGLAAAAAYYDFGQVTWTSGSNSGLTMEVRSHTTGGTIALQMAMPYAIVAGDAFSITPGCAKTISVCNSKFSNSVNFRGFPDLPGIDRMLTPGGVS